MDSAIRNLETNPYIGKPLRGELSGKWSLRIGDFRIIYTIDERQKTVTLYSASHRRTAYK
jgi:mRNA interferase RelE/StbE